MPTPATLAVLCLTLLGAASTPPPATPAARTPLDHAKALPALPIENGVTPIPLHNADPFPWRPIRDGITIRGDTKLTASYVRTRGKPAGAALLVRPGTLADLHAFTITASGNRAQTLSLSLTQSDGSVWTVGPINIRAGEPREITLLAEDVELDPHQNGGRPAATFDPASVYMLTLLDIAGYMSVSEPECEWTVASFKAVHR